MLLFYDYDKYDDTYPDYTKTFMYCEVRKKKHLPDRVDYVIKECTIELGSPEVYIFTYAHISNYKKNI